MTLNPVRCTSVKSLDLVVQSAEHTNQFLVAVQWQWVYSTVQLEP